MTAGAGRLVTPHGADHLGSLASPFVVDHSSEFSQAAVMWRYLIKRRSSGVDPLLASAASEDSLQLD
jgi:hypothetical protein